MLHRFDMSIDDDRNRLSINEYSVLGRRYRRYGDAEAIPPAKDRYDRVYQATYDGESIRSAIKKGKTALISELRSDGFFPVSSCAELLAEKVIELFEAGDGHFVELFFDDRTAILPDEQVEDADN